MGHSYEQIKDFRRQSKAIAVQRLLSEKNSVFVGESFHEQGAVTLVKKATRRGRPPKKVQEIEITAAGAVTPPKKKRGRPRKVAYVDVAEEAAKVTAPVKKKRGRPKGSKNKKKPAVVQASPVVATEPKKRGRKKGNPNEKEIAVMKCLNGPGRGRFKAYKIKEIAEACFPDIDQTEACLWVRTSLRRPVNENWVEKAARGEYRMNLDGRAALKSLTA